MRPAIVWLTFAWAAGCECAAIAATTPEEVYARSKRDGRIHDIAVVGAIDLTRLEPPAGVTRIEFTNAKLDRVFSRGVVAAALKFSDCNIASIDITEARFLKGVEFEGGSIRKEAFFQNTSFEGPVRFTGVEFHGKTKFSGSTFEQTAEFIDTNFLPSTGLGAGTRFSNTKFKGAVRFDGTRAGTINFDSALFASDANFLKFAVQETASFRNAIFQHDAEFRFCKFGRADFGDFSQMSAFHGLADFRGCEMGGASFDFAEFRGTTTFVNAKIGDGGLSLKNASFRGESTDLTGLKVAGSLPLDQTYFARLRFRWSDLGAAVLRASPDATALSVLHRSLEELKQVDEAQQVYGFLETQRMRELVASDQVDWTDKLWKRGEWLVWGLPTGYGTRLGRIVLIAIVCWLLLALPFASTGVLVRLDTTKNTANGIVVARKYRRDGIGTPSPSPRPAERLHRVLQQLAAAYAFSFALMFKTPSSQYCLGAGAGVGYVRYARGLWLFGSVLLAMMAITLAKTSPALQALIGKIAL